MAAVVRSRRRPPAAVTAVACIASAAGGLFQVLQPSAAPFAQAPQCVLGDGDGAPSSCRVRVFQLMSPVLLCSPQCAAQADEPPKAAEAPTGDAAVADLLRNVKVFAVVDESGAPVMQSDSKGRFTGYFYIREQDAQDRLKSLSGQLQGLQLLTLALSDVYTSYIVRGNEASLGGRLQLQPDVREVRYALKRLNDVAKLGEDPGLVPLFLSPDLMLRGGGAPLFLHETQLLKAMEKLLGTMNKEVKITTLQAVAEQVSAAPKGSEERFFVVSDLSDIGNFD